MSKRNKVSYIENDEPAFIKQFKERIGYKEGPNVDTKREIPNFDDEDDDDDRGEKEEEQPTVVVLKPGDITAEEAEKIKTAEAEKTPHAIGDKITFKKPIKRQNESEEDGAEAAKKEKKSKSKEKKKKAANLLSFNDEEEEEEEDG